MTEQPLYCDMCGSASDIVEESEDFPAFANSRIIVLCDKCESKYISIIKKDPMQFIKLLDKIN